MLGTMFEERNKTLLHPTNGNEYYIDRNGRLFYCILQFYRTGKVPSADKGKYYAFRVHFQIRYFELKLIFCFLLLATLIAKCVIPITQQELEAELDYFMIPRTKRLTSKKQTITKLSLRSRNIAAELDDFITALKTAINRAILYFQKRFIMSKGVGFNVTLDVSLYAL